MGKRRLYGRLRRSEYRRIGEGKMELRGLLKSLRLFLLSEMTSDIAEWGVRRKRLRIDGFLCFSLGGRSLLIFPGFDFGAIFLCEDARMLQIFFGVDVLGFFLSRFFPCAPLPSGFRDILCVG